jgi:3-oxoacyl-[acyl-carrier-protein] synthase III
LAVGPGSAYDDSSMSRAIQIVATGVALPKRQVTAQETDTRLNLKPGWSASKSQVLTRYFATAQGDESSSGLAAQAARNAAQKSAIDLKTVDMIIVGSASPEQAIPSTAVFVQRALGLEETGVMCFDVNSTCLSFLTALDVASSLLVTHQKRRALVLSVDIPSLTLNWSDPETASLFGDAGAAMIIEHNAHTSSKILKSKMKTFSEGAELCRIQGAGSANFPVNGVVNQDHYRFEMDGPRVFKLATRKLDEFFDDFVADLGLKGIADFDLIVPHQASGLALSMLQKRYGISDAKIVRVIERFGNTVSTSIPLAFDCALNEGRIHRGQKILLVGTSAGISLGAMALQY